MADKKKPKDEPKPGGYSRQDWGIGTLYTKRGSGISDEDFGMKGGLSYPLAPSQWQYYNNREEDKGPAYAQGGKVGTHGLYGFNKPGKYTKRR